MEINSATSFQWIQLLITVIGLVTLFVQIGHKQGEQEEKNNNFAEHQTHQRQEIDIIKTDISIIRADIGFIKGKLLK